MSKEPNVFFKEVLESLETKRRATLRLEKPKSAKSKRSFIPQVTDYFSV